MGASNESATATGQFTRRDARENQSSYLEDGHRTRNPVVAGIPAYNEELTIGTVVLLALDYVDEVVVVDDGSTDRTAVVARKAGATVLRHEENEGKGVAIRSLVDYLRERKLGACVLFDGDGQHAPADIPGVVEPVVDGDADLVIGSRYVEGGTSDGIPLYRRVGQQVLDLATTFPTRTHLTDTQSGFRALSAEALQVMSTSANGFGVESEMIDIATRKQLVVRERPISVHYDAESTLNPISHGIQVLWFNLQLLRNRNTLLYFGVVGGVFLLAGVVASLSVLSTSGVGATGVQIELILAQLSLIVGILCLFVGFVVKAVTVAKAADDGG